MMSLAPCPPASPRPLSPSYHHRLDASDHRRTSSASTSLVSPGYTSCSMQIGEFGDRQRLNFPRRTSMNSRLSQHQEDPFPSPAHASFVAQKSPTHSRQGSVMSTRQSSHSTVVAWLSRPDQDQVDTEKITRQQSLRRNRRRRQRPAPLILSCDGYEEGESSTTSPELSPRTPRLLNHSTIALSPRNSPSSPRSPRSPRGQPTAGGNSVRFGYGPLSPIPHSPQPPNNPPRSPVSPTRFSRPTSPCPSGQYRPQSPGVGNLARLASRRRSNAVGYRRTSNFLELPVSDYERQQRRFCSLPEKGYNPRNLVNDFYRLRAFSITPNGALIKHGDQIARRPKSSACSTGNNSRNHSRPASRCESRDGSPRRRSPLPWTPMSPSHKSMCINEYQEMPSSGSHDETTIDHESDENEEEAPIKFRVCMLGHTGTGKTCLVNQFLTSEYMNAYDASLDDDFGERSVSVSLDGVESELIFIDHTSGEMSVENTLSTYEPHACIVIYSVVDQGSFNYAEDIVSYLSRFGFSNTNSVILVANKVDLERSRIISTEDGRRLATNYEVKFIETSACIQHNVDELLVGILKQMKLRQERRNSLGATKNSGSRNSRSSSSQRRVSSPLQTLQVARDILSRVCISSKASSKSCENLHVL